GAARIRSGSVRPVGRRPARVLPTRGRDHHAAAHRRRRLPCGRARRARDRSQPAAHVQGDLRRRRAQLVLPLRQLPHRPPLHQPPHLVLVGHEHDHIAPPCTTHPIWCWWDTNTNHTASYNLTQTLLTTTPLILTGLAVAFAFRCGLFNIGGQGQYLVGAIVGVYVGSRFTDMAHLPHVIFGLTAAALAGALWGSIAGFLKATVGAHEVITTIMLNWIAYWGGSYLFGRGGPLQNHVNKA